MYQAVVFFDLDGTLMRDDKTVAPSSVAAIKQLKANQVLPVIATGRNVFEVADIMRQTGIDSIVSANGSYVQYKGKFLAAHEMDKGLLADITHYANQHQDALAYYNNAGFALSHRDALTVANYRGLHQYARVQPDFYRRQHINFLLTFDPISAEKYQWRYYGQLTFVRNNPRALDTMIWGVSKATGIHDILVNAGLTGIPTYAFGDAANDLEMFQMVDKPVAMGNGLASVKHLAAYITADNMHDGIKKGLAHFDLI
ncbi:Cof-type HAD-IIB family hydrolase [Lactiplantibacillus sp. WILCCON 0030]|uniref:Cof-type HAD-IIB family hydrolase n=1 Tax=Lactiplantibacillus brownii TaxID=3069269 RepID=A0ABU1A6H1_9LACO|nr:Cof-type HAD-IIB family hydrolase [Lactiplantibacillus brownii]MDQ7936052.1 Cof-type HAD-IIB family hydrolase [Lactiplantibacillus brownii]